MHAAVPKRRWFRFSLRTLFLVMTLASWLAFHLNWIRLRHDALAHLHIGNYFGQDGSVWNNVTPPLGDMGLSNRDVRAPWSLRLLGESGISTIAVFGPDHERIAENFRRLFPEASVSSAESPSNPWELAVKLHEQARYWAATGKPQPAQDAPAAADRPTVPEE